jgi:aspartyl-tRNA(Asn)/glutamyl-tRNA(Gln) amidotransferase subunit A
LQDIAYISASEAISRFRRRELSPVELTEAVLERAGATEPAINAFAVLYPEQAMAAARLAERRYVGTEPPRPLEGVTVAIKELTPVAGQQHTLGSLAFKDNVATETALAAERIIDAGGIVHGRTATPEFGCASFTHSRLLGLTRNPWNTDFSPAGSSGGAAAALAVGSTTLAQGSDSAGSLRLPASACGVVGYKPPYGRVPNRPPLGLESTHHDGPMARTVADCALLENVMAGPHPGDPVALDPKLEIPARLDGIAGMRIAIAGVPAGLELDSDVAANLDRAARELENAGAEVENVHLGWTYDHVIEATKLHFASTYGPQVEWLLEDNRELLTPYAIAFAEEERRYASTVGFALRGNELIGQLWTPLSRAFSTHQVLICPTLQMPAPEAGKDYVDEGPVVNGIEQPDRWIVATTVPFNLCSRCPAMSVPAGLSSSGVPTGVQIVGRPYDDVSVFRVARALELARPWLATADQRPRPNTDQPPPLTKESESRRGR